MEHQQGADSDEIEVFTPRTYNRSYLGYRCMNMIGYAVVFIATIVILILAIVMASNLKSIFVVAMPVPFMMSGIFMKLGLMVRARNLVNEAVRLQNLNNGQSAEHIGRSARV